MKVNLYITEEVSDEDRKAISEAIGVRHATRDEIKEFMWTNGSSWRSKLGQAQPGLSLVPPAAEDDELASLL